MIDPIKQNLAFTSNVPSAYAKIAKAPSMQAPVVRQEVNEPEVKEKKSIGEKLHNAKIGLINVLKGFNNVKDTTKGAIRGTIEGVAAASLVGCFGKNLKNSQGQFFPTVGGFIKDIGSEAWKAVCYLPKAMFSRTPWESVKAIVTEPFKLAKGLKGNPATIAAAAAVGVGFIGFRTIQGKINANKANADVDHKLNEGHVPTK